MPLPSGFPSGDVLLRDATVPGCTLDPPLPGLVRRDLRLDGGRIAAVGTELPGPGLPDASVALDGGMVLPGFVELHTHLDKGHIWPRATTPDGTHPGAVAAVKADPAHLKPTLVWAPGVREALENVTATRDKLLITTLDNVRGRAWVYTPAAGGGWTKAKLDLPDNVTVGFGSADDKSNLAFVNVTGFLTPNTVSLVDASTDAVSPVIWVAVRRRP